MNIAAVKAALFEHLPDIDVLICGGAPGLDQLAEKVARGLGIHVARVDALWKIYGHSAGLKRNEAMRLLRPDRLLAFPGGTGTADMTLRCMKAGVEVIEIYE